MVRYGVSAPNLNVELHFYPLSFIHFSFIYSAFITVLDRNNIYYIFDCEI